MTDAELEAIREAVARTPDLANGPGYVIVQRLVIDALLVEVERFTAENDRLRKFAVEHGYGEYDWSLPMDFTKTAPTTLDEG